MEAEAAADLALVKAVSEDPTVPVRIMIMKDLDSPELAELVGQAGLLVLGRQGAGGQVAFSLGTVSAELARGFHCPILVVHDGRPSQRQRFVSECAVFAGMDTDVAKLHLRLGPGERRGAFKGRGVAMLVHEVERFVA